MSILAAMFVTLFISYYTQSAQVKAFFLLLQHRIVAKEKNQVFSSSITAKKLLNCLSRASALYNYGIVPILLENFRKSL